ncbi:MAG: CapA family protein [Candidatus Helarchaeota archaeon]
MNKITIAFVGDISLNDKYVIMYEKGENPFKMVTSLFSATDGVIGNLECMAKGKNGENILKIPRLTTTVETLNYLKKLNVKLVSLAHNHVYDHLEDGFIKTTEFLLKNGIRFIGASRKKENVSHPSIFEKDGIKVGFLNYIAKDTNPNLPEDAKVFLNFFNMERAYSEIKELKVKVNHVVVIFHWGGRLENGFFPDWDQPSIAHNLIDAGADLIIGHHSHTIQPYEIYKDKYIFYSLGNFCFSDIFHNNFLYSKLSRRQKQGRILIVHFGENSYKVEFKHLVNENGFIKIIQRPIILHKIIQKLFPFVFKHFFLWKIYFFKLKIINPIFNYIFVQKKTIYNALKIEKVKKHFRRVL